MQLYNYNTIYAMVTAIVLFAQNFVTDAIPLKRNKRSNGVAEFQMPQDSHSAYRWGDRDSGMSALEKSSQEAMKDNLMDCPATIREGADVPTHLRSSCPWYYKVKHDPTRFPTTILEATSPCQYCIGADQQKFECVAIFKEISVLQQEGKDSNGNYIYAEKTMNVRNGYTCAGKKTANNAATPPPANSIPDIDRK